MFSQSVVTASYKKQTLKLNVRQINSQTKKGCQPRKTVAEWKDHVVTGDFYGVSQKKGCYRQKMEDAFMVGRGLGGMHWVDSFGVFDGHAGEKAALFASESFLSAIQSFNGEGLRQAFLAIDSVFCAQARAQGLKDGTTATVALLHSLDLYCGSVGDSRALLVTDLDSQPMSTEHLASDPQERYRIESAGGHVLLVGGVQRVQGTLAVSRSIGDPAFKEFLIPEPSLFYHSVDCSDVALVLASDGLFNVMSDSEIASTVRSLQHYPMHAIAEALAKTATDLGSRDNITVLLVDLRAVYARACQACKPSLFDIESDEDATSAFAAPTPKAKQSRNLFDF